MTLTAGTLGTLPISADVRGEAEGRPVIRAGTYTLEVRDDVVTGWHSHDLHQMEYAFEGVVEVETATARYLLPPQQAVWIPAGTIHCSTWRNVKAVSVFFDPVMGLPAGDRVRILAAAPVIREMVLYARRWPIRRAATEPMAEAFFDALAHLVVEWLDHETPLCLPNTPDPLVAAAMEYTNKHLADVSLPQLCTAVGTSERSLRRAFLAATGMSWRRYLLESRLLRAMSLLAQDSQKQTIITIALAVGFQSVSAFTRAFGQYTGETPTAYRQRVRG
ncbi:AraC family transcriptional regulator [Parafrankia discariae]|uniref:AraC family transcriptional regulator n=1 Tax=Parafrankia discariae TaxID=365528 RepID=UPI000379D5E9